MLTKQLKAFTMMELLVSMTLTGILVAFAFMGYNQMQKLFLNYAEQSEFISHYNQLNKALTIISNKAKTIEKTNENNIVFNNDSSNIQLEITKENFLLKFKNHTDTFKLDNKEVSYRYQEAETTTNLITQFTCDVFFKNQKFRVSFGKQYDAQSILNTLIPKNN